MTLSILARLEAATGPDRTLDAQIGRELEFQFDASDVALEASDVGLVRFKSPGGWEEVPRYTSSLDASLALVERLLPGWSACLDGLFAPRVVATLWDRTGPTDPRRLNYVAGGNSASLALLAALLKALIPNQRGTDVTHYHDEPESGYDLRAPPMTNAGVEPDTYGELVARALKYAGPVRMGNGCSGDLVFELAIAIETLVRELDALKHDIGRSMNVVVEYEAENADLKGALRQAQETLHLIINPAEFKNTSVMSAWALAVEAESRARTALRGEP